MREMVLNHASLAPPDEHTCLYWLRDLAIGMNILASRGVVDNSLRSSVAPEEIWCLPTLSLRDAMHSLRSMSRDEALFLLKLTTKSPLLAGLNVKARDQFQVCETISLPPDDGEPLLICAIQGWVAISFPSALDWQRDSLIVRFRQLLNGDRWRQAQEAIDNLSCSAHASPICDRNQANALNALSPAQKWERRDEVFSSLLFGLDVDAGIRNSGRLHETLGRLERLNNDAAAWQKIGGPVPPWSSEVSPESGGTMNDPRLSSRRMFRSYDGTSKLFGWHAKFGSMRIHLRFDATSRIVEIGYIGSHLPLD